MTLAEVIEVLDNWGDDLTIYAAANPKWDCSSLATAFPKTNDGRPPTEATVAGMSYVLEVWIAKEVLEFWGEWRGGRVPTTQEKCEAALYYAEHDAYIPIEEVCQ